MISVPTYTTCDNNATFASSATTSVTTHVTTSAYIQKFTHSLSPAC
jgi:hypothetical protein